SPSPYTTLFRSPRLAFQQALRLFERDSPQPLGEDEPLADEELVVHLDRDARVDAHLEGKSHRAKRVAETALQAAQHRAEGGKEGIAGDAPLQLAENLVADRVRRRRPEHDGREVEMAETRAGEPAARALREIVPLEV